MKKLFTLSIFMLVAYFSGYAQVNEDFSTLVKNETVALDGWVNYAEAGSKVWVGGSYSGEIYAYFNAYNSGDDSNIGWLITPGVNLDEFPNDSVKFDLAYGYFVQDDPLAIMYSTDYDGTEGGIASATWTDITAQCNIPIKDEVTSTFTPFKHTAINIDDMSGTIYVAFVFTGSGNDGNTTAVEVDNVVVGNPKPQSRVLSFSVSDQILGTDIDVENSAIALTVYPGTDVTALVPEMELSKGATVSPAIGSAQDFTNPVEYTVTSSDEESVTTWTVTVDVLSSTPTPIYDLQFVSDPETSDASPYVGKPVFTTGIVTYGSGSGSAYIQSAAGEWNGVYVYVSSSKTNISLNKGDSVLIYGTLSEYYHLTEFVPDSVLTVSDRKSVDPTTVTAPLSEGTEGVLVKVNSLQIKDNGDTYAGFNASGDSVVIEKELYADLMLTDGSYYNITGIVTYSYSKYRLYPRSSDDVELATSIHSPAETSLSVYPNPVSDVLYIEGTSSNKVKVMNILGSVVKTLDVSNNQINVSSLDNGVYLLSVDSNVVRFVKK
ncbi:T9SS type A sorting domain-containing protein [Saccharicrinis sp. FJH62]|uniref:T9SS type A sorting domain-containing protein n=1 Tax=Saccharicrinis sp. FJH62 TaxID=3344657 RepID=UPI0035D4F84A